MSRSLSSGQRQVFAQRLAPSVYFTIERADAAITLVARVVADVREAFGIAVRCRDLLIKESRRDQVMILCAARDEALARFDRGMDELSALGVELRDVRAGSVTFPARVGGREIRYCWRPGEARIGAWQWPGEATGLRRPNGDLIEVEAMDREAGVAGAAEARTIRGV